MITKNIVHFAGRVNMITVASMRLGSKLKVKFVLIPNSPYSNRCKQAKEETQ